MNGSWVDAATIQPSLDGSEPPWTFSQKGTTSRIDICLLNASAMQLFSNFEQWDHEECTIPNHKLQCITLTLVEVKQFATKPFKPFAIPHLVKLSKDDVIYLTYTIIEKYVNNLSSSYENNEIETYWATWCRLAEDWLLSYYSMANVDPDTLEDPRYRGRGHCCFEEKCVNVKNQRCER